MHATFLLDYDDPRIARLLHDIRSWLNFHARAGCRIKEEDAGWEDDPGRLTRLTVEFDNVLDAVDFAHWRDMDRWMERR